MEKTISINIGGLIFNIEEEAYNKLHGYLESIKAHYDSPEEKEEIMADIESSVAEKFSEKVDEKKKVITLSDVDDIIKVMGTVAEIVAEGEKEDRQDEKREEKAEEAGIKKRLYRDPDDTVIAGVCAGLAAYFGIDPVFIRVVFIILLFANGIGLLAYIIFWIVIPKAKTGAQKLEMRGKPVNLLEIQQAVKEKSQMIGVESREAFIKMRSNRTWYKVLNFPIKLLEAVFNTARKIWRAIWPALAIISGLIIIVSTLAAILGISTALGVMIFNISSPYIVSDLPLNELAAMPAYYIAVIAVYLAIIIPVILVLMLGVALLRRKNTFRTITTSSLIAVWMLAVVAAMIAAADLAPRVQAGLNELGRGKSISRAYDYRDFNKLYIGGNLDLQIKSGDEFAINLEGRESDLDRLNFSVQEGQLQITQSAREVENGICLFCFDRSVTGEIIMPRLDSFVGIRQSDVDISGFTEDIYVSIGEMSDTKIDLMGQNMECSLAGAGARLELAGVSQNVSAKMIGVSRLVASDFSAKKIDLDMSVLSRATLAGLADELSAVLDDTARLSAFDLRANKANIQTDKIASAEIWAIDSLKATANHSSRIIYKGEPGSLDKKITGEGAVESYEYYQNPDVAPAILYLHPEVRTYSAAMSSVRGIGLTPIYIGGKEDEIIYKWETNQGTLVDDWEDIAISRQAATGSGDKIYWTFIPGKSAIDESEPVYVYITALTGDNEEIEKAQIKFYFKDEGIVSYIGNDID